MSNVVESMDEAHTASEVAPFIDSSILRSRSPHPYRRRSEHLLSPPPFDHSGTSSPIILTPPYSRQHTDDELYNPSRRGYDPRHQQNTSDDSGTEADDEHFLKGLPAPKNAIHRQPDTTSAQSYADTRQPQDPYNLTSQNSSRLQQYGTRYERYREMARRFVEIALIVLVIGLATSRFDARDWMKDWSQEISSVPIIIISLLILYPARLLLTSRPTQLGEWPVVLQIPQNFDPAPLLYPLILPILVALLLAEQNPASVLVNLVLSLASIPEDLVPLGLDGSTNVYHWALSCVPITIAQMRNTGLTAVGSMTTNVQIETLTGLYALHRALCVTLRSLTTTSLIEAELQLMSISLINVLLLAESPQVLIIQGLLWIGGVGILVSCFHVLSWIVTLARVPRWRFKRDSNHRKKLYDSITSPGKKNNARRITISSYSSSMTESSDEDDAETSIDTESHKKTTPHTSLTETTIPDSIPSLKGRASQNQGTQKLSTSENTSHTEYPSGSIKRVRLPDHSSKTTPSGRRKRRHSSSMQYFLKLTENEADVRNLLYSGYVYLCIVLIILVAIREYVGRFALNGHEPLGWALAYLFGDNQRLRMAVVTANLDRWIVLPSRDTYSHTQSCSFCNSSLTLRGTTNWLEHLRHATFGPANTRLLIFAYWAMVIFAGLCIVFRLSAIYAVDTRRKVFHFMMVAMLFPATFVDPTYTALALSLVLAVFLLLDLFRATQLPPLSKPLAYFLTPYVDGRDLRGPVVISHIFLLIGCAIPLWLSLAAVPRIGVGALYGWEIEVRDVSMISGVICVGLGDSAASLIGRRFGRHKWFWSGGKSIEGSIAFAIAVSVALFAGKIWLAIGGWRDSGQAFSYNQGWLDTALNCWIAAVVASLTEAVLTGGNDNVVVPVVLWLCVKGLKI